jgi:site-specific recombinase XerC
MAEYRHYLEGERGLSTGTVRHYLRCARVFLTWLPEPVGQSLPALSAGQVTDYVLGWTAGRGGGAAVDTVSLPALRSLLRFLHVAGHVRWPLAAAVPSGRRRPRAWARRGRRRVLMSGPSWPAATGSARPAAATTRSC